MSASLKLVSLNIERSRHLDVVLPFLEHEQPEVVCLQELLKRDIPVFEKVLGPCVVYGSEGLHPSDSPERELVDIGNGIFSGLPAHAHESIVYTGDPTVVSVQEINEHGRPANYVNRTIVLSDIEKDGLLFRIATTHLTWTPVGHLTDDAQRTDAAKLLEALRAAGECVLTGDFNAARGSEIFSLFADRYTDNIPAHYTTTIDKDLHRAGDLQYVVDGLFSTPEYIVSDVKVVGGLSDHMAVIGTISKS